MTIGTKDSLALFSGALGFGVAADLLARNVPGRLDVALGLGVLLLVGGFLVQCGRLPAPRGMAPFGLPLGLLTVALIWRDSPALFGLNLTAILVIGALASPGVRVMGWSRAGLTDYLRGASQLAGGASAGSVPLLFREIDWRGLPEGGVAQRARGVLVGLVAAAPIAALFAGLLMGADPVFEQLIAATLVPELDRIGERGAAVLVWSWIAAGTLRLFLSRDAQGPAAGSRSRARFGLTEVAVVLGVLDLLFLAFVAVQFSHLFGEAGLSPARYAREGFFQLVTVAALSLPVLLFADWVLARRDPPALLCFRLLASVMLILLNVMLASALWRMRLYTAEYGLTELRFYTTAFMGWLVLVFGWFAATVLRGRRERFGAGALSAAFLVLAALNLVNPDGLIAHTNLSREATIRALDADSAASLSADALPTIHRLLPSLPPAERCAVLAALGSDGTRSSRAADAGPSPSPPPARGSEAAPPIAWIGPSGRTFSPGCGEGGTPDWNLLRPPGVFARSSPQGTADPGRAAER